MEDMSTVLPRLRMNLDFMPSPVPERPGLLIRDSLGYSEATLIIPPQLVEALQFFNGVSTDLDLREYLVRLTGSLEVGDLQKHLCDTFGQSGLLENEAYYRLKEEKHREFAESASRAPAHAGSAYPEEIGALEETMRRYLGADRTAADGLVGIAAPHVSPEGGWLSYRSAYSSLSPEYADRTFVVLGTSHYGTPDKFGMTRKPYATPYGEAQADHARIDWLVKQAPGSILMEDYCHSIEHSIEFQVLFLQSIYGPRVKVLPILCGSYARSIYEGGKPEENEDVRRYLDALGELADRDRKELFWVLGIDMAHIGRRYGDEDAAVVGESRMVEVEERDRGRIERIADGDGEGFWDLVQERQDDLKWCGASPLYTFLQCLPRLKAELKQYEQWNIDEQSVVSFAGMTFRQQTPAQPNQHPADGG
jgi:AmmeMemoRadiSam system protein B